MAEIGRTIRYALILLLTVSTLGSCKEKATLNIPIDLHFGYKSYTNIDDVKKILNKYKITNTPFLDKKDKRPNFNIAVLETKHLKDNGFTGNTKMIFYNDKLAEIRFYPKDCKRYIDYITNKEKMNFILYENEAQGKTYTFDKTKGDTKINGNLKIEIIRDNKGKYFIIWSDLTLEKKLNMWINIYS